MNELEKAAPKSARPGEISSGDGVAPRKYRWPWVFWGAVVLFIALAVLWVGFAANRIATQADPNAPLPGTAPMR